MQSMNSGADNKGDSRLAQFLKGCPVAPLSGELISSVTSCAQDFLCRQQQQQQPYVAPPQHQRQLPTASAAAAAADSALVENGDDLLLLDLYRAFPTVKRMINCSTGSANAPPRGVQPVPLLLARDSGQPLQFQRTLFEGEWVACFVIGGERRLCLSQLLHARALRHFSITEINRACVYLNIQCAQCSREQLNAFKVFGVLPITYANCSLITNTDAVRLHSFLSVQSKGVVALDKWKMRERGPVCKMDSDNSSSSSAVPVMHSCFGGCFGRFYEHLYNKPSAECIECDVCGDLFSVYSFVSHSHRGFERNVCHWGFDAVNWRSYLHLPLRYETNNTYVVTLEQFKGRFPHHASSSPDAQLNHVGKRSHANAHSEQVNKKRFKVDDSSSCSESIDCTNLVNLSPCVIPNIYEAALLHTYSSVALFNQNIIRSQADLINNTMRQCAFDLNAKPPNKVNAERLSHFHHQDDLFFRTADGGHDALEAKLLFSPKYADRRHPLVDCKESVGRPIVDHSSVTENAGSIDSLLRKYVTDPVGLQLIRERILDSLRNAEMKRYYLEIQNRLLLEQLMQEERRRQFVADAMLPSLF